MAAPAGRLGLTAQLGSRASLAAPLSGMAAPLSAVSMAAAPRPAFTRLGMAGPQGVDLSLEKFNLSAAGESGAWAGCLEVPAEAQHLAISGEAFWADLDSASSVLGPEDKRLFVEVFNKNLSDRQADGDEFVPPPTNAIYVDRLRALVKVELDIREQRKAHFFSSGFSADNVGPLFPPSWTSSIEVDGQQGQKRGAAPLVVRPELLAEKELLAEAIRASVPTFKKRAEDGSEFLIYRLGSLEIRAVTEPGRSSEPEVGAVFSQQSLAGPAAARGTAAAGPRDEDRIAKVSEFVERAPYGKLRCQYYVVFHTEQGHIIVCERLLNGGVAWQMVPKDGVEDRNSFAKVLRSTDCYNRSLTVGAIKSYLAQAHAGSIAIAGNSAAQSKRHAHALYCRASGEEHGEHRTSLQRVAP